MKVAVLMAEHEICSHRLAKPRVFMRKPDFPERENVVDMKRFRFQVLNFNEHSKNSYIQLGENILLRGPLSRIKPMKTQGLTAVSAAASHEMPQNGRSPH